MTKPVSRGLSLSPFRALRPAVDSARLATMLCPPYDVIGDAERAALLERDADNAVALILPRSDDPTRTYEEAADRLAQAVASGLLAVDGDPGLYVYEMASPDGSLTRGLLGAVELRDPQEGVILPHENTMAGPVTDRLALMKATQANLEPIYLVYDGGGFASQVVREADSQAPLASTTTPDGLVHRLWALTDPAAHAAIEDDLSSRRALIADGHHRYATYRELQRQYRDERGPGPWDRGLTLLVDSTAYGPQVHAIHRVLPRFPLGEAVRRASETLKVAPVATVDDGLADLGEIAGFAVVVANESSAFVITDPTQSLAAYAARADEPSALGELDVTLLHRSLVERVWGLPDTEDAVGYAHTVPEAISAAAATGGSAVLLRPTPVTAVAAVAAAGGRMPRKSTLFTPKPASGLVMRRFLDAV